MSAVTMTDLFIQAGDLIAIDGSRPQMLDDPAYAWTVGQGSASLFLVTFDAEGRIEERFFLFEAEQGSLLFGIEPAVFSGRQGIMVTGLTGTQLIRVEAHRLQSVLEGPSAAEIVGRTSQWLDAILNAAQQDIHTSGSRALPAKETIDYVEYLQKPAVRVNVHTQILQTAVSNLIVRQQEETERRRRKWARDQRVMEGALTRLARLNDKQKEQVIAGVSGHPLLDACRIVGANLGINISAPATEGGVVQDDLTVDHIARASRVRTREVVLQGSWYNDDSGPMVGFMVEDDRPVALIPQSPGKYLLHDPQNGSVTGINKATAAQVQGSAIVVYRPFRSAKLTLWDLAQLAYQSCWKQDFVMILLMGAFSGVLALAIPVATGIVFTSIIPEGERTQLLQVGFFLAASALATVLFQYVRAIAVLRMEGKMESALQPAVWDRLLSLPVPFFRQFTAGELTMRAMGIGQIRQILSGVTLNTILSSIFSVFSLALLVYYDAKLALVAMVLIGLGLIVMGSLGYIQVRYERQILEVSNRITGLVYQLIGGVSKFRVAGAERRAFGRWSTEFVRQRELTFKRETIANWLSTFNAFFPISASMIIFYSLAISEQPLPPGQFVAFNAAFISVMVSMISLSESVIAANAAIPLYQRAKPILETLPEYDDTKLAPRPLTGDIEVSNVSFRYKPDGPLILQDVSFQVKEGEYVGLVGTSGCGKSTLFRVLLGFEQPEAGNVYYNGQDLAKVDVRSVRKQLGVVLQNGQLMLGSIFDNIVGANPNLTIEDAWTAAEMSGVKSDIEAMPMGMHTFINEGATTISGGQKQRLLIARAIVNRPKILLFDEATSALDNNTQAIVSRSLDGLQATRIVIAHRLSTIVNCDRILVMDKGRVIESGTYAELMAHQGIFAELASRQLA